MQRKETSYPLFGFARDLNGETVILDIDVRMGQLRAVIIDSRLSLKLLLLVNRFPPCMITT